MSRLYQPGAALIGPVCRAETSGSFKPRHPADGISPQSVFSFAPEIAPSDAASMAAKQVMEAAGISAAELDFVISCTTTPDFNNPGLVSLLLHRLGRSGIPGLELRQLGCSLPYALDLADRLIAAGEADIILISCVDFLSRYFADCLEPDAALDQPVSAARRVMGDGACALLMCAEKAPTAAGMRYRLRAAHLAAAAEEDLGLICRLPSASQFPLRITKEDVLANRHLPRLEIELVRQGLAESFEPALQQVRGAIGTAPAALASNSLYGSMRAFIAAASGLPAAVHSDSFLKYGYTGAAGPALALLEAEQNGLRDGEVVLLVGIAGGKNLAIAALERL